MLKKPNKQIETKIQQSPFSGSLIISSVPGYFLIICLLLSFGALIWILLPFMTVLMTAVVLTVVFYPIYKKVLKMLKGRQSWASLISCFLVLVIIVIPISVFVLMVTSEAQGTYKLISTEVSSGKYDQYLTWREGGYFYEFKKNLVPYVDLDQINLKQTILEVANNLKGFMLNQTVAILSAISSIVFSVFLLFFSMYYFFKDGQKIVDKIGYLSPLPSVYESELFKRLNVMIKAIVFGVLMTSVLQGVVGGIGFWIVGISGSIFWGAMIAFASLVPVVGTAFVWVPAAIVLLIMGNYWSALFIFLWGFLAIGTIDNIARPYLIQGAGGKAKTYPLLIFFVILGGIFTMGFKGIIVGPILLMVLMTFLHVYQAEYSKVLKR